MDQKITAEDVISKLKDDGDFDRLRLKIIRSLKHNEDLRNNIISVVKQSAALNRAGAENMKPRQLCDAIHDEVREEVMNQISDGIWEIIRSGDSMKNEITETVQSIYDKLLNPQEKPEGKSASFSAEVPVKKGAEFSGLSMVFRETSGKTADIELKEPPGSSQKNQSGSNYDESRSETCNQKSLHEGREAHRSNGSLETEGDNPSPPPGFSSLGKRKQQPDGSDEDPDIPPGFG